MIKAIRLSWTDFKSICLSKKLNMQSEENDLAYNLIAIDGFIGYRTTVSKENLLDADLVDFQETFLSTVNKSVIPKTSNGTPKTANYEAEGDASTIITHNYADKCSWAQGAVQVTDEVMVNTIGNKFASPNNRTHWIDLKHGRLYDEDNYLAANLNAHPIIKVDGVTKIETVGLVSGDYTINYPTGEITFNDAVAGVVTCSYRYADKSWFSVRPHALKVLSINTAEVQFADDTILGGIGNEFVFEVWYNHPIAGWVPVPGTAIKYKNAKDFISACNGGTGKIEAWAEITRPVFVFPFNYARPKPLKASQGVEVRVYTRNHQPVGGQYATATFYVLSETEL